MSCWNTAGLLPYDIMNEELECLMKFDNSSQAPTPVAMASKGTSSTTRWHNSHLLSKCLGVSSPVHGICCSLTATNVRSGSERSLIEHQYRHASLNIPVYEYARNQPMAAVSKRPALQPLGVSLASCQMSGNTAFECRTGALAKLIQIWCAQLGFYSL